MFLMLLITFAIALHCLLLFSDIFFSFVFSFFSLYFIASIWMNGEFIATTLEYNQFHFHHIIITHVVLLLLHWMLEFHFHRHQSQSNVLLNCYWLFDRIEFSSHEVFSAGKFKWKFKHLKFILGYLFCRSNYHALNTHGASLLSSMYICINIGHNLIVISKLDKECTKWYSKLYFITCANFKTEVPLQHSYTLSTGRSLST